MGVNKPQRRISPPHLYGAPINEKPHTLRNYAMDHFRSPIPSPKSSVNGSTMLRGGGKDLWRHSRVPITEPLLRRLLNKEELAHQACVTYHTILRYILLLSSLSIFSLFFLLLLILSLLLRYMGDIPGRHSRLGIELTDNIFDGPLKQG